MKILELTNYTAGGCGVGMRVLKEAKLLSENGHEVVIFSTNRTKGSDSLCSLNEKIGRVLIKRFPTRRLGGESYMYWNFEKEALCFKPDVIIAHAYRHIHTLKALKIAKKLGCKIFLVTHAPFGRNGSRTWLENKIVNFYDNLIGKYNLNRFDKIITITKWEEKYLKDLGVEKERIVYIPNGISDEFFKPLKLMGKSKINSIIYTGRISPIKNLELISHALKLERGFSIKFIGPADNSYINKLKKIAEKDKVKDREEFITKSYNSIEQINELDKAGIFILPSKSEGMPQTLVEAMSRGKIVIGSDNEGNKELINSGKNGFLFKNSNYKDLARILDNVKKLNEKKIRSLERNARKKAEQFRWRSIMNKLESTINL